MGQRLVAALDLRALLHDAFAGAGLGEGDAAAVADVLVDANLRGVESHGLTACRSTCAGCTRGWRPAGRD